MTTASMRIQFPPALMTRETAAHYLDTNLREVDQLRHSGRLPAVGEGKRVKFRKTDLDKYIDSLPLRD